MATNPGLFTEWPWKKLGNFKVELPHLHILRPTVHVLP
jgi:hypothetical protein